MVRKGGTLFKDVAFAYADAYREYERACSRGNRDKIDEALSRVQTIENCITIRETNTEWRRAA